jgi:hypothetical protein
LSETICWLLASSCCWSELEADTEVPAVWAVAVPIPAAKSSKKAAVVFVIDLDFTVVFYQLLPRASTFFV